MINLSAFYAPIQNVLKSFTISLVVLFDRIKNDPEIKALIEPIRNSSDKSVRDNLKKLTLFCITFSGIFFQRAKEFLIRYTGLICIDIDGLSAESFIKVKNSLKEIQKDLVGYFISPSGNGYKVLIKIDNQLFNHEDNYLAAVAFLQSLLGIDINHFDTSCKNVARACFISHDPNAYLNELASKGNLDQIAILDTDRWRYKADKKNIPDHQKKIDPTTLHPYLRDSKLDYELREDRKNFPILMSIAEQNCGAYQKGNRHTFLQRLASNANKFGMNILAFKEYCIEQFEYHPETLIEGDVFLIETELIPIIDDTYNRYTDQFATWIEEEIIEEIENPCFDPDVYKKLPELISEPLRLFTEPREKDVFLMGFLALLSTWMPKVNGIYDGKYIAANLFVLISAPASSGKGVLHWIFKLSTEIRSKIKENHSRALAQYEEESVEYEEAKRNDEDAEKPVKPLKQKFLIPGNISSAAIINCIAANKYFGLIFETEADTLTNVINNGDWGNFLDILRKCFHHEMVSLMRKKDDEDLEIERPHLSTLLSGTPSQIIRLANSVENGFFSRLLIYDFPLKAEWKNVFDKKNQDLENYFLGHSIKMDQFLAHYFYDKSFDNSDLILFDFTAEQKEKFNGWFKEKQSELSHIYGDDIIASVRRLAVCFFRIAMILSVLRHIEKCNYNSSIYTRAKTIECSDVDYDCAKMIINTLLFHTIKIYNQVKGSKRNKASKGKRNLFIEKLPNAFNRSKAMEIAAFIGIKEKTAENYVSQFIKQGLLQRLEHNKYEKIS